MLNPRDSYPAETSPRPIGTAYDTVHAQPDVALDFPFTEVNGGWSNGLSIQYKQVFAVKHGLITPVIGHLHSLMADVNRHVIADALFFVFNRQVTISGVVLVTSEYVGKY